MKEHLSPRELASAMGVSESSIKRWSDAGRIRMQRTAGGHRRIPTREAVRFIRDQRHPLDDPSALGLPVDTPTAKADGSTSDEDQLFELLRSGDGERAFDFVRTLYIAGLSVEQIVDGPFRVAFKRIGELWQHHGDAGVMWEHRATQHGLGLLQSLRTLLPERPLDAPLAVGGAPAGDPYQLPSMAVQLALEAAGFKVTNLGANTPIGSFVDAAREIRPLLLWVSATAAPPSAQEFAPLFNTANAVGSHVVVGGQRALGIQSLPAEVIDIETVTELTAFAKGLARRQQRTHG
jgi:excisionase family DNA binding protein